MRKLLTDMGTSPEHNVKKNKTQNSAYCIVPFVVEKREFYNIYIIYMCFYMYVCV